MSTPNEIAFALLSLCTAADNVVDLCDCGCQYFEALQKANTNKIPSFKDVVRAFELLELDRRTRGER